MSRGKKIMKFTRPITDIIRERSSVRTYNGKPLENEIKEEIKQILENNSFKSPFSRFGEKVRFKLISMPEFDPKEKKKLGTYGVIEGAQDFIVGAVNKSKYGKEHYGYILETIILIATDKGLGTCWLGGTFTRSGFSKKINKEINEIVPAITPVGYWDKTNSRDVAFRANIKANTRLPWKKLFFEGNFTTPLDQEKIGVFSTLLEMVRISPSAGNRQPYRIIKEVDRNIFHFYVEYAKPPYNPGYNVFMEVDIGIAVSHFNLCAQELGIQGDWFLDKPEILGSENFLYSISWKGDN